MSSLSLSLSFNISLLAHGRLRCRSRRSCHLASRAVAHGASPSSRLVCCTRALSTAIAAIPAVAVASCAIAFRAPLASRLTVASDEARPSPPAVASDEAGHHHRLSLPMRRGHHHQHHPWSLRLPSPFHILCRFGSRLFACSALSLLAPLWVGD